MHLQHAYTHMNCRPHAGSSGLQGGGRVMEVEFPCAEIRPQIGGGGGGGLKV